MVKRVYKRSIVTVAALLFFLLSAVPFTARAESALVTTRQGLVEAVYAAGSGDTVLVGDIEFHDYPPGWQILNSLLRVTVDKSITVKGAKPDGSKSVLSGGSFIINGPQDSSQKISCVFENIVFDGGVDGSALVQEDWDLVDMEPEPYKAQFAASFKGNADVRFENCDFMRYMHEYGGALMCLYEDYEWAKPGDFFYDYRYNTFCALSLSLADCAFTENTALYAGGAVYMEGERVALSAENCVFLKNTSSLSSAADNNGFMSCHGEGGGAIRAIKSSVSLTDCEITRNIGNRVYGNPNGDPTCGGGVSIDHGKLAMTNCVVSGNTAGKGGGLYILMSETFIDGCDISGNRAATDAIIREEQYIWHDETMAYNAPPDEVRLGGVLDGMRNQVGRGGGVYMDIYSPITVTFRNTRITGNSAQNAYGGFYGYYNEWHDPLEGFGKIDFIFCTYADNRCEYDYSQITERVFRSDLPVNAPGADNIIWETVPGDVWQIAYVRPFGCVIADEEFGAAYPRYELPSEENGFNYFGSPQRAIDDGVLTRPIYEVPAEIVKSVYGGRFADITGRLYSGTNDSLTVRSAADARFPALTFVLIALGAVTVAGGALLLIRRRKPASDTPPPVPVIDAGESSGSFANALTAREAEVAALLGEGRTQKAIAETLYIGLETVKTHTKNIYSKLGVKNKYELITKLKR
jgi:DNA-binding CsgD family transcriptional regulator